MTHLVLPSLALVGLLSLGPSVASAEGPLVAPPEGEGDADRPPPSAFRPLRPLGARDWAVGIAVDVGVSPGGSYDDTLQALGYDESGSVKGAQAYGGFRLVGPLWLGARAGFRSRNWQQPADTANATGIDGLVELSLRFPIGRWLELGGGLGGGLGAVRLRLNDVIESTLVPRLHAALFVGVPLPGPVRLLVRGGWDLFAWNDANGFGDDVDIGGFFVGGAVEIRP